MAFKVLFVTILGCFATGKVERRLTKRRKLLLSKSVCGLHRSSCFQCYFFQFCSINRDIVAYACTFSVKSLYENALSFYTVLVISGTYCLGTFYVKQHLKLRNS